MTKTMDVLPTLHEEYGKRSLSEEYASECPIEQFNQWFSEHMAEAKHTPNAMVVSTVDDNGEPDARVVLLKGLEQGAFIFYTDNRSVKSGQINSNAHVALSFYWPESFRQIRVRGEIISVPKAQADAYFSSRPVNSQLMSMASTQSAIINNRDELENALHDLIEEYLSKEIVPPKHWVGYAVIPSEIEFWQGRDNRCHDRLKYQLKNSKWHRHRLAP